MTWLIKKFFYFFIIIYFDDAAYRDHFDINLSAQSQVLYEIFTFESLLIPKKQ